MSRWKGVVMARGYLSVSVHCTHVVLPFSSLLGFSSTTLRIYSIFCLLWNETSKWHLLNNKNKHICQLANITISWSSCSEIKLKWTKICNHLNVHIAQWAAGVVNKTFVKTSKLVTFKLEESCENINFLIIIWRSRVSGQIHWDIREDMANSSLL